MFKDHMPRIQFILKNRETYWGKEEPQKKVSLSSGLFNSAKFVCEALSETKWIQAEMVSVEDNNAIDKEVTRFRPDIAIIEAFWVVPEKFAELHKLHPKVKWIVRCHSELPFAAQEGIAMDWILRYLRYPNVYVSGNSIRSYNDILTLVEAAYPDYNMTDKVVYLPNIYPLAHLGTHSPKREDGYLDVACFGAIRPLKNHLLQATAAIKFAVKKGKKLRFHINGGRIEGAGSSEILKNLRLLFSKLPDHDLVEHGWYPHDEFLNVLKTMDIGLQVSFSETFNIVGADMAHVGLPLVASKEVLWSPKFTHADPTDSEDIYRKLKRVWFWRHTTLPQGLCQLSLNRYSLESLEQWIDEIEILCA